MKHRDDEERKENWTRRGFLVASGTMAAVAGCGGAGVAEPETPAPGDAGIAPDETGEPTKPTVSRRRTLGRTGFEVGDIAMGCGQISEANVVRYAYDRGVNLFDVAETYSNGDSERKIGEAMQHMDRDKIFVVTKLKVKPEDSEATLLDRFGKCLERLKTDHVDALYSHSVTDLKEVKNAAFHGAVAKLKAEGRVKHAGISSHGPRGEGNSMSEVLLAAVEDGRFDLMLLVHNFMKPEEGEKVLAACAEKNIGTTGMKTYSGQLKIEPFDPDNPTEEYAGYLEILAGRGMTREAAVTHIQERLGRQMKEAEKTRPALDAFVARHGIKTQDDLDKASIQWVLGNPRMHTICVSMPDFDRMDLILPLSGSELSAANRVMLDDYRLAYGSRYCRHGCTECLSACPSGVPVSTVMRYSYYFTGHHREKHAIQKYAALGAPDGLSCLDCNAPCEKACPHGVPVQASMMRTHGMLTLA